MMKFLKIALAILVLLVNLVIAPPSFADPIAEKSPEYPQVIHTLTTLLQAKANPDAIGYTAEALRQKISDLQFQRYIMETTEDWGVCRNMTGRTIGVFAHKPKKFNPFQQTALYYLSSGQTTDEDWDCDGVYLPGDLNMTGVTSTESTTPLVPKVAKILDGTRLTISANPMTGEFEFNAPLADVVNASDVDWSMPNLSQANILVPNLSQASIDMQMPNAPVD